MESYIFLTTEGNTFQPNSEADEPDVENLQVIGFGVGSTPQEAYIDMLSAYPYLAQTTFDEIFCYKLDKDYEQTRQDFSLKGQE
jgi:hypothetical protein